MKYPRDSSCFDGVIGDHAAAAQVGSGPAAAITSFEFTQGNAPREKVGRANRLPLSAGTHFAKGARNRSLVQLTTRSGQCPGKRKQVPMGSSGHSKYDSNRRGLSFPPPVNSPLDSRTRRRLRSDPAARQAE